MEEKKEITAYILAKSNKHKAYCVGGVDISTHKLVRFVSTEDGGALTNEQMKSRFRYRIPVTAPEDEEDIVCEPLYEVTVPIIGEKPLKYQPENVLIDTEKLWKGIYSLKIDLSERTAGSNYDWFMATSCRGRLTKVFESLPLHEHEYLFGDSSPTLTKDGMDKLNYSLAVIEVSELEVRYTEYRADNGYGVILRTGRERCLASFVYNNVKYDRMRVTDPYYLYGGKYAKHYKVESSDEDLEIKTQNIGQAYLVASVPNKPFEKDGLYYKFIAAIYPKRFFEL